MSKYTHLNLRKPQASKLINSLLSPLGSDCLDEDSWNRLLQSNVDNDEELVNIFREFIPYDDFNSKHKNEIKSALVEVLSDATFPFAEIFEGMIWPLADSVEDMGDIRRWVLLIWLACINQPFQAKEKPV